VEGLKAENRNLRSSNGSLSTAKGLLQHTLLEQMAAIRAELATACHTNQELEVVVTRQKENAARLQVNPPSCK
jgi:hypothetical protein